MKRIIWGGKKRGAQQYRYRRRGCSAQAALNHAYMAASSAYKVPGAQHSLDHQVDRAS